MPSPRQVLRGQFYLISRSCVDQKFLLRPDKVTNNAFTYCLALAAGRTGIVVIGTIVESNHHHTLIYDPNGRMPEFITYLHGLVSRCMNVVRGREGSFWEPKRASVVTLLTRSAVMEKLVYLVTNPVKDGLVERVHQWPGVNGYSNLIKRRPMRATRPPCFFRDAGPMPASVTLDLVIPPELGPEQEILDELQTLVKAAEQEAVALRRKNKRPRALGRRKILSQSWNDAPAKRRTRVRRKINPRFASKDPVVRLEAILSYRAFLNAYRAARALLLENKPAVFPQGTYWLVRFAGVSVGPPPELA